MCYYVMECVVTVAIDGATAAFYGSRYIVCPRKVDTQFDGWVGLVISALRDADWHGSR